MPDARGLRAMFGALLVAAATVACAPAPTPAVIVVTATAAVVRRAAVTVTPFPSATPIAESLPASPQATPTLLVPATRAGAPTAVSGSLGPPSAHAPTATSAAAAPANAVVVAETNTPADRRMVALVFGQSNAGNYGDVRHTAGPRVLSLRYGRLTAAADPLRGAQGDGGSMWSRLGDRIVESGWYDEVILVPVAFGGTEIAQWVPEMPLFKQIQGAADDVRQRGWTFTHLLWHQGESDNANHVGWGDYQLRFRSMLGGIRRMGIQAPVFVSVATRCGAYEPNVQIQGAQMNLVNHDQGIWAGPNTDKLDAAFRVDGCHLNGRGQDVAAADWLAAIAAYERALGRAPVPRP